MTSQQLPHVDVGVLTWNTAELTVGALRRLLDTDQGVTIRLLVHDNASSDDTVNMLRTNVPEAEIDAGDRNLGFSGGVNTLIARSTAPWFFLLNSDAWPLEGAIGRLVNAAQRHPRAAVTVPRIEYPDGRLQHTTHPFPSLRMAAITGWRWDKLSPQEADELYLEGAWQHDRERELDWAHAAAMLFRADALREVGGFDERFFFYAEDLDWCWRAHQRGFQIWLEPTAVVQHVQSASGDQLYAAKRTRAHLRNALRFYRRTHGLAPAIAWWGVNAAGGTVHLVKALRKRDRSDARRWRNYVGAQLTAPFAKENRPD
jgi:GT2 family glycosyltransferase